MTVRLLYLAGKGKAYLALDTSGFKTRKRLSKKYGIEVKDIILIPMNDQEFSDLDPWPTDMLMSYS